MDSTPKAGLSPLAANHLYSNKPAADSGSGQQWVRRTNCRREPMHLLAETDAWDAFPRIGDGDDLADRHDAHRAIGVSAVGLAATGLIELAIAILSGSVGLLS